MSPTPPPPNSADSGDWIRKRPRRQGQPPCAKAQMVGVPRSSGCHLCRTRRVKCDAARPGCANCVRYGAACPGYVRGLKFVHGKHQIRRRTGRRGSLPWGGGGAAPGDGSGLTALVAAPRPNRGQFISTLVAAIRTDTSLSDVTAFVSWVALGRLGARPVLDAALCSLALHLVGKERADAALVACSRTVYGRSLAALQASLRHATEWRSSETLCAALLLCVFELFAGTSSPLSWLQHARGIATLVEQRGAAAHAEGWDASMMIAARGVLIMCDMFYPTGKQSFLSRPEWKSVVRDRGRRLISARHPPEFPDRTVHIVDDYFQRLAELTEIVLPTCLLRESRRTGAVQRPAPDKTAALARRAADCRRLFGIWYEEFKTLPGMPKDVPSRNPGSPFPVVLHHEIPWVGSMHMGYWASMLILQEALAQCQWPGVPGEPLSELVLNILRSLESVATGIMGPYRVGYATRIVYEFASPEHQRWILGLLDTFSKTCAATDATTYPSPTSRNPQASDAAEHGDRLVHDDGAANSPLRSHGRVAEGHLTDECRYLS